jgi:amylosucrase
VVANFDEHPQVLNASWLEHLGYANDGKFHDLIVGKSRQVRSGLLEVAPFQLLWLNRV